MQVVPPAGDDRVLEPGHGQTDAGLGQGRHLTGRVGTDHLHRTCEGKIEKKGTLQWKKAILLVEVVQRVLVVVPAHHHEDVVAMDILGKQ